MVAEVVVGGVGVLIALAVYIGVSADREARETAWRHIAAARRRNAEKASELEQAIAELDAVAEDLDHRERLLVLREERLAAREVAVDELESRLRRLDTLPPDVAV